MTTNTTHNYAKFLENTATKLNVTPQQLDTLFVENSQKFPEKNAFKSVAKSLSKSTNTSHNKILNDMAKTLRFADWGSLTKSIPEPDLHRHLPKLDTERSNWKNALGTILSPLFLENIYRKACAHVADYESPEQSPTQDLIYKNMTLTLSDLNVDTAVSSKWLSGVCDFIVFITLEVGEEEIGMEYHYHLLDDGEGWSENFEYKPFGDIEAIEDFFNTVYPLLVELRLADAPFCPHCVAEALSSWVPVHDAGEMNRKEDMDYKKRSDLSTLIYRLSSEGNPTWGEPGDNDQEGIRHLLFDDIGTYCELTTPDIVKSGGNDNGSAYSIHRLDDGSYHILLSDVLIEELMRPQPTHLDQ